jgi:O-acetyl-ADP-ribose deacetylase (regulator of RNase III)
MESTRTDVASIIYRHGNLLKGPEPFACHGCNAQGVMGSGIAKEVRAVYPAAWIAYKERYDAQGLQVGDTIWVEADAMMDGYPRKTIINAVTQEFFGRDPDRVYVDYEGVRAALREINLHIRRARFITPPEVGFPLIGAGLANGSWKMISTIIMFEAKDFQPVVYLFDGRMPQS